MARIVDSTNQLAAPRWAGDFGSPELGLMRGGFRLDAAQWETRDYTITVTEPAIVGAVALTVAALPVAIPADTVLDFTGAGEMARVTVAAAIGATSLTVEALDAAIEDNDTATFTVTDATPVSVASGTAVGRTLAERDAGDDFGPADAADDEIFLTYFDVWDASINPDFVAYRPYAGRIVKENFLPGFDDLAAGVVTALRARYQLIRGAD
jgi:hypothetical protein